MFFSVLYFSPPCAANAARARSIGEVVAVIGTAGVASLTAGGTAFALVSVAFVFASPWANTLVETHNARVSKGNNWSKVFFMGSFLFGLILNQSLRVLSDTTFELLAFCKVFGQSQRAKYL